MLPFQSQVISSIRKYFYLHLLIDEICYKYSEKETSEASLLAMESQKKSAEREFDRVNDELKKIQNSIQSDKKDD